MTYTGFFSIFCEMGGGVSLIFKDHRCKYLEGYAELEMCYFFRHNDMFNLEIYKKDSLIFKGPALFELIQIEGDLITVPKGMNYQELIGCDLIIKTDIKLYEDKIILDSGAIKDKEFLKNEIRKLLTTETGEFEDEKKQLLELEKIISDNFYDYCTTEQDFLFGRTPLETILMGRGSQLLKIVKEKR